MKITAKRVIYFILILLIGIQFIQIDKTNPPVDVAEDFFTIASPPEGVKTTLRQACFDCHSHETVYPWYSNVAPASWILADHIQDGREELNFSTWGQYEAGRKDHKLEEVIDEVKEGEMPLTGYVKMHAEAELSEEQKAELFTWVDNYRQQLRDLNGNSE